MANPRASSTSEAVPLALSSAPLKMVSPLASGLPTPMWSQCALYTTVSSGCVLPSRRAATLCEVITSVLTAYRAEKVSPFSSTGLKSRRCACCLSASKS
ncbi:hypothetical protein D3C71_1309730 [compost metagenome]